MLQPCPIKYLVRDLRIVKAQFLPDIEHILIPGSINAISSTCYAMFHKGQDLLLQVVVDIVHA